MLLSGVAGYYWRASTASTPAASSASIRLPSSSPATTSDEPPISFPSTNTAGTVCALRAAQKKGQKGAAWQCCPKTAKQTRGHAKRNPPSGRIWPLMHVGLAVQGHLRCRARFCAQLSRFQQPCRDHALLVSRMDNSSATIIHDPVGMRQERAADEREQLDSRRHTSSLTRGGQRHRSGLAHLGVYHDLVIVNQGKRVFERG